MNNVIKNLVELVYRYLLFPLMFRFKYSKIFIFLLGFDYILNSILAWNDLFDDYYFDNNNIKEGIEIFYNNLNCNDLNIDFEITMLYEYCCKLYG